MKRKKLLIVFSSMCLGLILAVLPLMAACAKPAPAPAPAPKPEPITLKAVAFLPTMAPPAHFLGVFADRVNERAKGELVIDYLGGPEVIPTLDQGEAVRTGVVDISLFPLSFLTSQVPEYGALYVSQVSYKEERERGFIDFLDELGKDKMNLHILGRANYQSGFYLFTKKRVEKLEDMAGLKIRSHRHVERFAKALGAVPIYVATAEAYSALEQGVCDAHGGDIGTAVSMKIYEVVNYMIDHPFYKPGVGFIMNLDTWNQLPRHLQDMITGIMIEFDEEIPAWSMELEEKARPKLLDGGMKFIKFSSEDAKQYLDLAYSAQWEEVKGAVSPESYAKIWGSNTKLPKL